MNTNIKGTLFVVIVSLLVAITAFHFMNQIKNPIREEEKPDLSVPVPPTREQQFEDMLNNMLHAVENDMKGYRKQRMVLLQAMNPASLTEPSYIEENYHLVEKMIPEMDKRIAMTMQRFTDAEKEMNGILLGGSDASRATILGRWRDMKNTQVRTYSDYFVSDKDLLEAYRQLMQFYYDKREVMFADADKGEIIFKGPADAAQEKKLKERILKLRNAQNALFIKPEEKQPAAAQ